MNKIPQLGTHITIDYVEDYPVSTSQAKLLKDTLECFDKRKTGKKTMYMGIFYQDPINEYKDYLYPGPVWVSEFEGNLNSIINALRKNQNFFDVTLFKDGELTVNNSKNTIVIRALSTVGIDMIKTKKNYGVKEFMKNMNILTRPLGEELIQIMKEKTEVNKDG